MMVKYADERGATVKRWTTRGPLLDVEFNAPGKMYQGGLMGFELE